MGDIKMSFCHTPSGAAMPSIKPIKIKWSKQKDNRLRKLWNEGKPVSFIAKKIGASEKSINMRANKIGLDPRRSRKTIMKSSPSLKSLPLFRSKYSEKKEGSRKLKELGNKECRWPHGNPKSADFGFCGKKTDKDVYCPYHKQISRGQKNHE